MGQMLYRRDPDAAALKPLRIAQNRETAPISRLAENLRFSAIWNLQKDSNNATIGADRQPKLSKANACS